MDNATTTADLPAASPTPAPTPAPAAPDTRPPVPVAEEPSKALVKDGRFYLTALPIRMWHWLNALAILSLIVSGVQLRYPDKVKLLGYQTATRLHDWAGIAVIVFFFWWGAYYGIVGKRLFHVYRLYVPRSEDIWPGLFRQAMFYLWGYFKGEPHPYEPTPDNKFNPMQKVFYALLMFVVLPLLCVTGIALLNVTPLRQLLTAWGGIKLFVAVHYLLACFVVMFLCIHIYLCTLGQTFWGGFTSMISGWGEPHHDHRPIVEAPAMKAPE